MEIAYPNSAYKCQGPWGGEVLTTAIVYGIMSNLYCRASASLKAQVGGHGELLKVIATEKIAKAEQKSYVRSQTDGMLPHPCAPG